MPITTLTSRQFNQDASKAKKAAKTGPVFITDRGRPAHVLLSIEEYQKLTGSGSASMINMSRLPAGRWVDFDPPRASIFCRPADLS